MTELNIKTNETNKLQKELKPFIEEYIRSSPLKEDELLSSEKTREELIKAFDSTEIAFDSKQDALVFAIELLKLEENNNVSHYKVTSNVSRKGLFYALEPILFKTIESSNLTTPSEILASSVYTLSMT